MLKEKPGSLPECSDRSAVSKNGEVYPGAKLEACEAADLPLRTRARAWIPSEAVNYEDIIKILQFCNPDICSLTG